MENLSRTSFHTSNSYSLKTQSQFIPLSCLLALILVPMIILFLVPAENGEALTIEDGLVENLTAVAFFFGAMACVAAIKNNKHKTLPMLWFFLCVVFLGEEVSWFQRHLNYSVESVESVNAQSEFNFHNLNIFHGKDSDHGNPFDLNSQNMFRYGFLFYFLALPFFLRIVFPRILKETNLLMKLVTRVNYIPPSLQFIFLIVVVLAVSFALSILANILNLGQGRTIAEYRECIYALVILFYTYFYLFKDGELVEIPSGGNRT